MQDTPGTGGIDAPKPVAIDLCCGLGGWTQGLLAEGWDVIGFDIERHEYGDKKYPAQLILKSILEINGYDLRAVNPSLVVASPPCQEFSYMAMPWSRAKQIRGEVPFPEEYTGSRTLADLTALFDACFQIAKQAGCPIVCENVVGAQAWVGPANAHYGSFYLWGDVGNVGGRVVRADSSPRFGEYIATAARRMKGRTNFHFFEQTGLPSPSFHGAEHEASVQRAIGIKQGGSGSIWFDEAVDERRRQANVNIRDGHTHTRHLTNQSESDAVKVSGDWFGPYGEMKGAGTISPTRMTGKNTTARKASSAMIAEIPFDLARHIARVFKPCHS